MVRSHTVNRIMIDSPYPGEVAAVDVNDAATGGRPLRKAIDEARARPGSSERTPRGGTPLA